MVLRMKAKSKAKSKEKRKRTREKGTDRKENNKIRKYCVSSHPRLSHMLASCSKSSPLACRPIISSRMPLIVSCSHVYSQIPPTQTHLSPPPLPIPMPFCHCRRHCRRHCRLFNLRFSMPPLPRLVGLRFSIGDKICDAWFCE